MDSANTPGSGASPPEPPRPPKAPDELWGIWWPEGAAWLSTTAGLNSRAIAAFEGRDETEKQSQWNKSHGAFPALIGVRPAAREQRDEAEKSRDSAISQRDKLGEALAEAESEIQRELDWLLTIKATDGLKYRRLKEYQRRWGILLIKWREAQEREHEGSTTDGQ
jgi:hypothetical protein